MNTFQKQSFDDHDWSSTALPPTRFEGCSLVGARFRFAQLSEVVFVNCDLTGARFEGCYPTSPDTGRVVIRECETNAMSFANCVVAIDADRLVNASAVGCPKLQAGEWVFPRTAAQWQHGESFISGAYAEEVQSSVYCPSTGRAGFYYCINAMNNTTEAEKAIAAVQPSEVVREAERIIASWMQDNPYFYEMLKNELVSLRVDDAIYDWNPKAYGEMESELAGLLMRVVSPQRVKRLIQWG